MKRRTFLGLVGTALSAWSVLGSAAEVPRKEKFRRLTLMVEGVEREALIYVPKEANGNVAVPVVFVFHGHGGSAAQAAQGFEIWREWPEAISVYMQGLNTPGRLTDREGKKSGWQQAVGEQGDRDLKFFDGLFARVKKEWKVDLKRVYATGHSNGGAFTYLLWETRPEMFAAFAPSGASTRNAALLGAKPAIHIAGQTDPLVKFEWQQRTMEVVRRNNGCVGKGVERDKFCTEYASPKGAPFVAFVHGGGHEFPTEAPAAMVRFFKGQALH